MIRHPEAPTVAEQVAVAEVSDDLAWKPTRRPVDVVTAAGMVGQRSPMAMSLMRFAYSHDPHAFAEALLAVRKAVRRRAIAQAWIEPIGGGRMPGRRQLERLSDACLRYWANPVCRTCQGRKFTLAPGVEEGRRALSTTACPSCAGEGKRAFQMRTAWWQARGIEVLAMIEQAVSDAEDRVDRKLA